MEESVVVLRGIADPFLTGLMDDDDEEDEENSEADERTSKRRLWNPSYRRSSWL